MSMMPRVLSMLLLSQIAYCASASRIKVRQHINSQKPEATPGMCPPGGAWTVFVELGTLAIGVGQHTEMLFCYLEEATRKTLGLPQNTNDYLVPSDVWRSHATAIKCYGIGYSASGIEIYEKELGQQRMRGAPTSCSSTTKYFKGCIGRWKTTLNPAAIELPKKDDGGWWLPRMVHSFTTCQRRWEGSDYDAFSLFGSAHNCNTFTTSILSCALSLDGNIHLSSPGISNKGFRLMCDCTEQTADEALALSMDHTIYIIDRRPGVFHKCGQSLGSMISKSVSASSGSVSKSANKTIIEGDEGCKSDRIVWDSSVDVEPQTLEGIENAPAFYYASRYTSGCYCETQESGCQCKVGCDRRDDCGEEVDHRQCSWCCTDEEGENAKWTVGHKYSWSDLREDVPRGQKGTCEAWDRVAHEKESRSFYEVSVAGKAAPSKCKEKLD